MQKNLVVAVLVAVLCSAAVEGFFLRLRVDQPVCFAEEIGPDSTVIMLKWMKRPIKGSSVVPLDFFVLGPDRKEIDRSVFDGNKGYTKFSPKGVSGEYDFCVSLNSNHHVTNLDFKIMIDHHDRRVVLKKVASAVTRDHLSVGDVFTFLDVDNQPKDSVADGAILKGIAVATEKITMETNQVMMEIRDHTETTKGLRNLAAGTFDRVWGFSLVSAGVVTVVAYVQQSHLKSFLRRRKLV